MFKNILISLAAALLLTGCSRDEIIDRNEQNAISFDNVSLENMTKVPEVTTGINEFYVHAILKKGEEYATVFDDTKVYISRENGKWTYSPAQYWYTGATYWFKAINLPVGEQLSMTKIDPKTDGQGWIDNTKVTFTNRGDRDLVYATHSRTYEGGTPTDVELTFHHALARVRFSFQNNLAEIYTIKVSDIQISNAITSGDITMNDTAVWTVNEKNSKLILPFGVAGIWNDKNVMTSEEIAQGITGSSAPKYLIPGNAKDADGQDIAFAASFKVDIYADGVLLKTDECTSTLPIIEGGLKMANSYNYTASISMATLDLDKIEFKVTTEDWGAENNGNINIED